MIEGWIGRPGAGKTLLMVDRIMRQHDKKGEVVWSNMTLLLRQAKVQSFESWEQLIGARNALVVLDEIGQWAASREWNKRRGEDEEVFRAVMRLFAQHRKFKLNMYYTAQNLEQVDPYIRRMTMTAYSLDRYGPFIRVLPYDPLGGVKYRYEWRLWPTRAFQVYDTYEVVAGARSDRLEYEEQAERFLADMDRRRFMLRWGQPPGSLAPARWEVASLEGLRRGGELLRMGPDGYESVQLPAAVAALVSNEQPPANATA